MLESSSFCYLQTDCFEETVEPFIFCTQHVHVFKRSEHAVLLPKQVLSCFHIHTTAPLQPKLDNRLQVV